MELKQPANTTAREASPAALPNSASQNAPNSIITRRPRFYGESAAFNFSDESVQTVANAILGEVLHQRYTIAQGVQGTITLVSPNPISPEEALRLLERALIGNGLRLIYSNGSFQILQADQALASGLSAPSMRAGGSGHGFESKIIPLRWVSAAEMEKLLKPYARPGAIVAVDASRNQLTLAGSQEELANYLRTIDTLDVDWMSQMTVASIPIISNRPSVIAGELEKIFGADSGLPVAGMVRFIPLDGAGMLIAISARQQALDQIATWIDRFEASGGEASRIYAYDLKYIGAKELADRLEQVVGQAILAGGAVPETHAADTTAKPSPETTRSTPSARYEGIGVSALEETNSVLIRATPAAWRSIREAIARIDVMPLQVHIEAQIAEVKTSGALRYGVSSFFDHAVTDPSNQGGLGLPIEAAKAWRSVRGSIRPAEEGVGWVFRGRNAAAVISLLDQISDVRMLQTPSIFVRNNMEAHFNAGSRIPVVSVRIDPAGGSTAYNQVQYLETGLVMKVKPRVTREGNVSLDIEQEVSTPGAVDSADANGNVRIDTNKLKTQVTLQAGDTIMLAGMTRQANERGASGVPSLSRIPVLGGLFGRQTVGDTRDELVMLITVNVATDTTQVRSLTDDYLRRFHTLQPMPR
jgi:general secretion pathway protein D